jgi:hypothetical protein
MRSLVSRKQPRFAAQGVIGGLPALRVGFVAGVKGQERLLGDRSRRVSEDLGNAEHLEIERTAPVGNEVMLVRRVGQVDAVGSQREQVDHGRAKELEP